MTIPAWDIVLVTFVKSMVSTTFTIRRQFKTRKFQNSEQKKKPNKRNE